MSYDEKLPEDFDGWPPHARRAWIRQGPLTQREMLRYASDQVGLTFDFEDAGPVTNDELGSFVAALLEEVEYR